MVSTILDINQASETAIEIPSIMTVSRVSELAKAYIYGCTEPPDAADLYLVKKALLNRVHDAKEAGLTPRDVIISLLRPVFSIKEHCGCTSCQTRCICCSQQR